MLGLRELAGNALVTPLVFRLSMGGGDCLPLVDLIVGLQYQHYVELIVHKVLRAKPDKESKRAIPFLLTFREQAVVRN
uniref:SFRICE_024311 n=1 Tax=Spodoptera frugiperda TaxID=7108 RepID=A0A2H1V481_SPOFR